MSNDKFNQSKKTHLEKLYIPDKSKKSSVDKYIVNLIDKINKLDDYFTTSSCSGRIMIIKPAKLKKDVEWLFSSHDKVDVNSLISEIHSIAKENSETLWLKLEGFILHVACRDVGSAQRMLNIAKSAGLKRSGIISFGSKAIVEIISSELVETPISKDKKLLVSDDYLEFVLNECNSKLEKVHLRIDRLEKEI